MGAAPPAATLFAHGPSGVHRWEDSSSSQRRGSRVSAPREMPPPFPVPGCHNLSDMPLRYFVIIVIDPYIIPSESILFETHKHFDVSLRL